MTDVNRESGWEHAWSIALDTMELAADEVEQMLRRRDALESVTFSTGFDLPVALGPLPFTLTDRARLLVQRQLELARELTVAIAGNRQQARLVSRLHREQTQSVPVFVDNRG